MNVEEKEYSVTLTLRVTTRVYFAPIERDGPITKRDAIDNAIGMFNDLDLHFAREGFTLALPIEGEAEEL